MKAAQKIAVTVAASWMLSSALLQGAEREFNDIVHAVSDELHARPLSIPFFGLINFATSVAHPAGVKHIDLATFQDLDLDEHAVRKIGEAIQRSAKGGWKPFVQVQTRNQTVIVYMHADSADCRLLVTAAEADEVTLVEVKLNPEALQVWLDGDRGVKGLGPVLNDQESPRHSQPN